MKSIYPYTLLGALFAVGAATAATTTTTPVGYDTISCPVNSDTFVGVPLRNAATAAGALTAASTGNTLTSSTSAFGTYGNGAYYVKFKTAATAGNVGKWYAITANTATTLTIDLAGDTLSAASGDTFEVIKFWTLATLFPPASSTADATTTGTAIVTSAGAAAGQRRTEILLPNFTGSGINLAPSANYYITGGQWKKQGDATTVQDGVVLYPDSYFIIRNPSTVTAATKYTITGEVEPSAFTVSLSTQAATKQDNFVALPRPINLTLNDLKLGGTAAFTDSLGAAAGQRRDEVLTFDNATAARNKAASANYYYYNGAWRKQGSAITVDVGTDVIPAGFGFIVRKYQVTGAPTQFWTNTPTY